MPDVPISDPKTAYFSMEIALDPSIPTYSGGLGVLAGDTLLAAADLGFPIIGVTLLYKKGYFRQNLNAAGVQSEGPEQWNPSEKLTYVGPLSTVTVEGRRVRIAAWRYQIHGISGHEVPVYLLDTDLAENAEQDRRLTDSLYGGDDVHRLGQEVVLGIGGCCVLRQLGYVNVATYHMNEGHSALLTLALIESEMAGTLNGVPSLSVLDGWWIEGCIEGVTGWAIGADGPSEPGAEASSLYVKLDSVILPMFYGRPNDYGKIMRFCIALNGGFFNTQRMLSQYISNAYSADCQGHWPTRIDNTPVRAADKSSPFAKSQTG